MAILARTYPIITPSIPWNDWLSSEQITLDAALLLSIGENPADINWHDTEILCTSIAGETPLIYELRDQAEAWIKNGTLNAEPTFDDDDKQQDYLVKPFDFFSLAVGCRWQGLNKAIYDFVKQDESIANLADSKPQAKAVGDAGAGKQGDKTQADTIKPRRKRKPVERGDTNEGLLLVDELLIHYKIEYLDELKGINAWGTD